MQINKHMTPIQSATLIRPLLASDYAGVHEVVTSLPAWFDERARTISIPIDMKHQRGFVAEQQGKVVGFITLYVAEGKLNIGWLGVQQDLHRQGIGRLLLAQAEAEARDLGIRELSLYTLGDGVDYEPYARTRQFYFANGFHIYQRSQTDNDGCPEEIKLSKIVA